MANSEEDQGLELECGEGLGWAEYDEEECHECGSAIIACKYLGMDGLLQLEDGHNQHFLSLQVYFYI